MDTKILNGLQAFEFINFETKTLKIESQVLKGNPLGDSHFKSHPVLIPKNLESKAKLIFVLSGYSNNAFKNFNTKVFEDNLPQKIDFWVSQNRAPHAVYVFINNFTFWGGAQYINSDLTGRYEDHICQEIFQSLKKLELNLDFDDVTLFGSSSGGYGALQLGSKYPELFSQVVVVSPDSFFDQSLLPEIFRYTPHILKLGGITKIEEELKNRNSLKLSSKELFGVMNVIAMASCYSKNYDWPIDDMGLLNHDVWSHWKSHDPIIFLKQRTSNLKKLKKIIVCAGDQDQYQLQYGVRQMTQIFEDAQLKNFESWEFEGHHFNMNKQYPELFKKMIQI